MRVPFGVRFVIIILSIITAITVLGVGSAESAKLIESDDFTGNDGDPPDPSKWDVQISGSDDYVRLENNNLRVSCTVSGGHWPGVTSKDSFRSNNVSTEVEFKAYSYNWQPFAFGVQTNASGTYLWRAAVSYSPVGGWFLYTYSGSTIIYHRSDLKTFQNNIWYTLNITVRVDTVEATIYERDTGIEKWTISDKKTNKLLGENRICLSVPGAQGAYDNFKVFDLDNSPPRWVSIPQLQAVEDVPLIYDFSGNVSDIDDPIDRLSISSPSQFVTKLMGLEVTFLFPNGVTLASVPLILTDGMVQVPRNVDFTIEPVNDPPTHDLKTSWIVREDTPFTIDFAPNIWDVDNNVSELYLEADDPYTMVDGLNITVEFPEGVLEHVVRLNLSDGEASIEIVLTFTVNPVDDPPTIDSLGEFTATEDRVSVFNLTPFLHDIDTPVADLGVIVREVNCTVHGHELHFLFTLGGFTIPIDVEVADAHSRVTAELIVNVDEVNDPPMIHDISPKLFVEDEEKTVELEMYIEDEDTPIEALILSCEHPAVVDVSDLNITLLYPVWEEEHAVVFKVFDGIVWYEGSFDVQVQSVNDLPRIMGVGALTSQGTIELNEGSEVYLPIVVEDEESSDFEYILDSDWDGIEVKQNGTIHIRGQQRNLWCGGLRPRHGPGSEAHGHMGIEPFRKTDDPLIEPAITVHNESTGSRDAPDYRDCGRR
jgi:hypothetical protein